MSVQNGSSSHCSRTHFTPAMERYFLDLMLEHIQKGNRFGHTFNKQAWTDMLAVFNAKFGSQYDKDVLKSRYTNLWKVFNDVKHLLRQDGFTWDGTRQMVIAEDCLWDECIKNNLEVRTYKTKPVLNFDDLCFIYEYTVADGRYSRSSHDVDVEDEVQGDCNGSIGPSCSSSITEWTPEMDQYFIELMLKQKEIRNMINGTFTKKAWTDMLTLFNARFRFGYEKRSLRQRYKKLQKQYSDLTALLEHEGFCLDERQETVIADEDVWDAHIKAHPHARSYKDKSFPVYSNMSLVFGDMISKESQTHCHRNEDTQNESCPTKSGGERSRTFWSPEMDSYLIDLMLVQSRKGYRIGQLFINQAWHEMADSFNRYFMTNHDREILKNRYKHFRKQYNNITTILQHDGFSWDERRGMVIAEDHTWDLYTKAHPYARSYRVKSFAHYNKLHAIYEQNKIETSESVLMDPMDAVSETSGDWTLSMERYFIELLLKHKDHCNTIDDALNEQAWAHMTMSMNEKFCQHYDNRVLEYHYASLKRQYIAIKNLLGRIEFSWDEELQMITAENDTWESYAKEHPDAISLRDKIIYHYNELCNIFETTKSVEVNASSDLVIEVDQHAIDIIIDEDAEDFGMSLLETDAYYGQGTKRSLPATDSKRHIKARIHIDGTVEEGNFTNITGDGTEFVEHHPLESAIKALQAIPDLDDEVLLDGCDLLEDENKARTFLALNVTLRKKWLLRKLGRL